MNPLQAEVARLCASRRLHRRDDLRDLLTRLLEESAAGDTDRTGLLPLHRELDLYYHFEGRTSAHRVDIHPDGRLALAPNLPPHTVPVSDPRAFWRPVVLGAVIGLVLGMVAATLFFVFQAALRTSA